MINEIQELLNKYIKWLKDKTALREINDYVEITTPYVDRHNDHLQIYIKRKDHGYTLTDDGYIISDLRQSGCELNSPKRNDLLTITLNGFGVRLTGDYQLEINATNENFALQKHNLVQAMLAINDLFYLSKPMVKSLFLEDVTSWLDLYEIRYTPRVKFTGKSGYDHLFDFVIPLSKQNPERILRTISQPNRDTAEAFTFAWIDTRDTRPINSKAYAILNDSENDPSVSVIEALKSYGVNPFLWSEREQFKEEFIN